MGDSLSYKQDAIATEAYLQTARSRISLRRHALLVDYHVHDGCNARTWIHVEVSVPVVLDGTKTQFYTLVPGAPSTLTGNERQALAAGVVIFEGMQEAQLFQEHNQMSFYTWGDENCCLPKGATEATLLGTFEKLQPGDVLIFEEIVGPQTGNPADADVRHRCAVRLTAVTTHDAQGNQLVDPLFEDVTGAAITSAGQKPTPVTEIQWAEADALPFPVCISSKYIDSQQTEQVVPKVSIVLGNNLLADHGVRLTGVDLGSSAAAQALPSAESCGRPLSSDCRGSAAGTLSAGHARQPHYAGRHAAGCGQPGDVRHRASGDEQLRNARRRQRSGVSDACRRRVR